MKKKILVISLSMLIVTVAICGYIVYSYFTPIWDAPCVGFPISSTPPSLGSTTYKPYTPADRYIQMLSVPFPRGKHNLPVPDKYMDHAREMYLANKEIFDEIQTFAAPTSIKIDFKIKGDDTIATYHGRATTTDGETIEYSRDVMFKGIIVDFVSGYGNVPRE